MTQKTKRKLKKTLLGIEKVLSMEYSGKGNKLIFSGVSNGQTDIYLYNVLGNSQVQITNDIYDDLFPSFTNNNTVIFSSNRFDDTIRNTGKLKTLSNDFDIFTINISGRKNLKSVTDTDLIDEKSPFSYDNKHYTFISNNNGVFNRYITYKDSAISFIDTSIHYNYFSVTDRLSNYPYDALEMGHSLNKNDFSILMKKNGKYEFYLGNTSKDLIFENKIKSTIFMEHLQLISSNKSGVKEINIRNSKEELSEGLIDIDNYIFNDEVVEKEKKVISNNDSLTTTKKEKAANFWVTKTRNLQSKLYHRQSTNAA